MSRCFKILLAGWLMYVLPSVAAETTGNALAQLQAEPSRYIQVEKADTARAIQRVVIPSFMVDIVSELNYSKNLSGLEAAFGADSDVTIKMVGVEQAQFQAMTDKLYDETVAALKSAGIEVVPHETLQALPEYGELSAKGVTPLPNLQDAKTGKGLYFTAKGLPLYHMDEVSFIPAFRFGKQKEDQYLTFGSRFSSGFSAGFNQQLEEKIAKNLDATVMKVRITLLGGQLNVDKDFWSGGKVSTRASANFADFATRYAFISPTGNKCRVSLKETVSTGDAGELVNVTTGGTKATDTAKNAALLAYNVAALAARVNGVSAPTVGGYSATSAYEYRVEPDKFDQVVTTGYRDLAQALLQEMRK